MGNKKRADLHTKKKIYKLNYDENKKYINEKNKNKTNK